MLNLAACKTWCDDWSQHIRSMQPEAICPSCQAGSKRNKCEDCERLGWVNAKQLKQLRDRKKK